MTMRENSSKTGYLYCSNYLIIRFAIAEFSDVMLGTEYLNVINQYNINLYPLPEGEWLLRTNLITGKTFRVLMNARTFNVLLFEGAKLLRRNFRALSTNFLVSDPVAKNNLRD